MFDPFAGLKKLGITTAPSAEELYKQPEAPPKEKPPPPPEEPEKYIFVRNHKCPVCDTKFVEAAVRTTKLKLTGTDTDLRPIYEPFDPTWYDVVLCPKCGHAAMTAHFPQASERQAQRVMEQIAPQYKPKHYHMPYVAEDVAERYSLALLCAVVKKTKESEKAMLCLRSAWVARSMGEADTEQGFLEHARQGFLLAYEKESFPVYGMDHVTTEYLIGELSRRVGRVDDALKYIGRVIVSSSASPRLKDRARQVKELIAESKKD